MINKWLKNVRSSLPHKVFCCYLCHDKTATDDLICYQCWDDLLVTDNSYHHKPGDAIDYSLNLSTYCFPLDRMLLSLKYKEKLMLAETLGKMLASKASQGNQPLPDCLVPVPLHSSRLIGRGFNQSQEIARHLGRELHIPIVFREVRRKRRTAPQFQLKPGERRKNVKGAFQLSMKAVPKTVAIVDDIVTTGETARELARTLKAAGVDEVGLWTIARAS